LSIKAEYKRDIKTYASNAIKKIPKEFNR